MRSLSTALVALALSAPAHAEPVVEVCFNYGCVGSSTVRFDPERLEFIRETLLAAKDAAGERAALAAAVGALYRMAGEQAPIAADRAGNLLDGGVYGRMDCIDHSTTTTRFLELLAARGWLRHHRVMAPVRRTRFVVLQHFSAAVEEVASAVAPARPSGPERAGLSRSACDCDNEEGAVAGAGDAPAMAETEKRFVIDSWFVEHGEAAVVLPLGGWLKGEGPNVQ